MQLFIDTADLDQIKYANDRGWVDGVTTNPTLIAKTGRPIKETIAEICTIVNGPVSAEVVTLKADEMVAEGRELAKLHDNVVVKIPLCEDGLMATKQLTAEGIRTHITLIFSPLQALLAAKAGATMISPFIGRLDDISTNGMELVEKTVHMYRTYGIETRVLVASVRHPIHVLDSAMMGVDIATLPLKVMQQIVNHPLTAQGIEQFKKDAESIPRG